MGDQRKSPKQKETEAEKKESASLAAIEESQRYSRVFGTADGKKVLRDMMLKCCYQTPITVTSTIGVDTHGMIHNAALHKNYVWLRSKINNEILRDVENPLE